MNTTPFQQSWPSLDEPMGATQEPRDDVIAQACYSVGIQDSMATYESCDPSFNSSQYQAQQAKGSESIWCPTPPSPKPECQECQFQKLCHKRSKDKMYRRMQRCIESLKSVLVKKDKELVKKDKEIYFLRKRVTELEQARCK